MPHVLALLTLLLLRCSWGQVKILSPPELAREFVESGGVIFGTTATFGAPSYGEHVLGRLLFGESKNGRDHCDAGDYDLPDPGKDATVDAEGEKMWNVVVVRRGQCTFVQKVRIAQEKGAHAVIMIDKKSSQKTAEEIQRVVMADDGYASLVKIPSVLISNHEGEKLLESLKKNLVIVELRWDIPRSEVVLVDFWMSSGSEESSEFLEHFKDPAEQLKYHMQFVPHYHVFSLPAGSQFGHLCRTDKALHCGPDPDGPGPITGAMVVNEDLRQLCLWHVSAEQSKTATADPAQKYATYSEAFWEYVVRRRSECPLDGTTPAYTFGHECSYRLMKYIGVDIASIQTCVLSNAELYLDAEVENVAWSPQALRLNGWRYNGPLDKQSVLKALCSGFQKPPDACDYLLRPHGIFPTTVAGIAYSTFFESIFMLMVGIATAFYLYKWYMTTSVRKVLREEVVLEVQSQMADYAALEGGDEHARSSRPLSF